MGKASRKRRERMEQVQQQREIEGLVKRARFYDHIRNLDTYIDSSCVEVVDASAIVNSIQMPNFELDNTPCHLWGLQPIRPPFANLFIEARLEYQLAVFNDGYIETSHFGSFIQELSDQRFGVILYVHQPKKPNFGQCIIQLDDSGNISRIESSGGMFKAQADYLRLFCFMELYWTFSVLQFLNCRNIVTVDHEPDPADNAAYQRHFGVPMTTYKTLAIKPMGKRYERDGEQQQFDVMPLHIRRGNFAHYTEDAPLFGKYTGTFWRPATAVGNAKNGIRVKDYEVKTDAPAYDEMANTAEFYLNYMQQKSAEAFAAMKEALTDE